MSKVKHLLAYMPVLHRGYIDFLRRHPDARSFFIFGQSMIDRFDWLKRKDIRAVDPALMRAAMESVLMSERKDGALTVWVLDEDVVERLKKHKGVQLVFADEEESRQLASELFQGCDVSFDSVFLRWDKPRVLDEKNAEGFPVTSEEVHRRFMGIALETADKSPDWWIHVGAALVVGDRTIVAYNRPVPSDHTPYALGDPRSLFKKGIGVELTSVRHSEVTVIGAAAREGLSTKGARLYVTTFPCPFCANALSATGISELYFRSGYSMLDGAETLRSAGIQIFRVVDEKPSE